MISEEVVVRFPEERSDYSAVVEALANFVDNAHVPDFSEEEKGQLGVNLAELKKGGLRGIIHVVNRGSVTGVAVRDSLPEVVQDGFYEQLHIVAADEVDRVKMSVFYGDYIRQHPESLVVIGRGGEISDEMSARLTSALTNRVGILLGGGPGSAIDGVYRPLLKALEQPLKLGTPVGGICLGHQMLGQMLYEGGRGKGVTGGFYELGPIVERITDAGKKQAVFGRLGDMVTVVRVNHDHVDLGSKDPDFVSVLSRDATGSASALLIDLDRPRQGLTTQAHFEFPMVGRDDAYSNRDEIVVIDGQEVTIPVGTHIAFRMLIKEWIGAPEKFAKHKDRYGLTVEDVADMVRAERLVPHLGERFYGPLVAWMVDARLTNS